MGKDTSSLGDRMKSYENVTRNYLTRRTPVIIRIDGCHFHTFTRGMIKPYDEVFCKTMQDTMKFLCKNVQNCVLGYTQSDEITLVLCDYKKLNTAAWFDNNRNKIVSVSASLATLEFNSTFLSNAFDAMYDCCGDTIGEEVNPGRKADFERYDYYTRTKTHKATFDARAFNIPVSEVCNCLIWRQQDATRNSIQGLGQKYFSHKQLEGKNQNEIQDMLMVEKGVNWNDVATKFKRGSCCIKGENGWVIDNEIPIFTKDRGYIEERIIFPK